MKTGKNLLVTLRVFRGKIHHDAQGNVTSENQPMKIQYGTLEWNSLIKSARYHFSKMEIEKLQEEITSYSDTEFKDKNGDTIKKKHIEYKNLDIPQDMKDEVRKALEGADKPLTTDQKKMADMQKQIDDLTGSKGKTTATPEEGTETKETSTPSPEPTNEGSDDMPALRKEYKELNPKGKGAYTGWPADVLKEKIEAFKA